MYSFLLYSTYSIECALGSLRASTRGSTLAYSIIVIALIFAKFYTLARLALRVGCAYKIKGRVKRSIKIDLTRRKLLYYLLNTLYLSSYTYSILLLSLSRPTCSYFLGLLYLA